MAKNVAILERTLYVLISDISRQSVILDLVRIEIEMKIEIIFTEHYTEII